jgi:FAD/FMN-containing dehydrogenase
VLATLPEPESTGFLYRFPPGSAAEVLAAWQRHAPAAPETLAASLVLSTAADHARPPAVTVFGATGDVGPLEDLLAAIGVAPAEGTRRPGRLRAVKAWLAGVDPHDGPEPAGGHTYLRSEYFRSPVPAEDLVARLGADRRPGESRELDFSPWGGAYCRVPVEATAFPHRDAAFLLKHAATVDPRTAPGNLWLDESFAITRPHGTGGTYPNFPEPDLADTAYFLSNVDRVRAVRAHYDPEGLFNPG